MKKVMTLISSFAFLTILPSGKILPQVLGDSTIQVKSIAENISSSNSPISLDNTNGKITLNGMDVTNLKENLVEVEARANTNDLKIGSSGNKFTIEENGITANTVFPITIDPAKNELSVTTNSGLRLINVLPYEATLSLMRGKFIDSVKSNGINLKEDSVGELEYSINGTKNINLFNIAKVTADVTSTVSVSNGEIIKIDEPSWLKFFGFLFS